jgi:predicted Zn-dependent peptidase
MSAKNIKTNTFTNGLQLVYEKSNHSLPISSIQIICNVGSVHETDKTRGVAHFIEHMIFKGTKKYKNSRDIYKIFDKKGTYFNASTQKRYTVYDIKCQDADVPQLLSVISDLLLNSVFDKKEYKKELDVVIEENIQDDNDYENAVIDSIEKMIYNGSNYQNPIDCMDYHRETQFTNKDVLQIYNTYYQPNHFIVSIVSNLKYNTILNHMKQTELVKRTNANTNTNTIANQVVVNPVVMYIQPPPQEDIQYDLQTIEKSDVTYLSISFRTCSQYADDKYALNLLKRILGGYFSSRMFLILREDNGLTYSSRVTTQYFENTGDFTITAITDHNKLIKNGNNGLGVLPLIIKMLNDLIKEGVTTSELVLAKEYNKGMFLLNLENNNNIAVHNGEQLLLYPDREFIPYKDIYEIHYKSLTKPMINAVIQKYLKKTNMNVCVYGYQLPKKDIIRKECSRLVH